MQNPSSTPRWLQPLLAATVLLSACGGDSAGISTAFGAAGKFRVVNGISDSTSISVTAPNVPSDLTNIAVNSASGFRTVPPSSFNATATINTASGSRPTVTLANVRVDSGQETTAYFPGTLADGSYASGGFFVENGAGSIANGNVELTIAHAASAVIGGNGGGTVNVYLTAPGAAVLTTPTTTVNYRSASTPTQYPGGSYRIRISLSGTPGVIAFDSGSGGVALAAGNRLQIAALNETDRSRGSALRLLVMNSDGTSITLQNTAATTQ